MNCAAVFLAMAVVFGGSLRGQVRSGDVDPAQIRAAVAAAARAQRAGDVALVRAAADEAVRRAGSTAKGNELLAQEFLGHGLHELCVQVADHGVKTWPNDVVFRGLRGAARVSLKQNVAAIEDLSAALAAEPRSPRWTALLARAYLFADRTAEAEKQISAALQLLPGEPAVLELKAEAEYRNQKLKEAEATASAILAREPKNIVAAVILVRCRRADGRHAAAIEAADVALKAAGESGEIRLERGIAALASDRTPEAISDLEAAAKLLPKDSRTWLHLCKAYARAGRKDDAMKAKKRHAELTKNS